MLEKQAKDIDELKATSKAQNDVITSLVVMNQSAECHPTNVSASYDEYFSILPCSNLESLDKTEQNLLDVNKCAILVS